MPNDPEDSLLRTVTVPGIYLADAVRTAEENGYNSAYMLRHLKLNLGELDKPGFRLSAGSYNQAIEFLIEHSGIPALGLLVGRSWSPSDFGVLGHGTMCADSLRHALDFFLKYQNITGPVVRLSSIQRDDVIVLSAVDCGLSGAGLQYETENLFIGLVGVLSQEDAASVAVQVNFSSEEPNCADLYRESFACEVTFSQPYNELWLSAKALECARPLANPEAYDMCSRQCEVISNTLMSSGSLSEQIRGIMASSIGTFPSEERIAESMGLSTRTLRRRLSEEGVVFREMLNEARVVLAQAYLKQSRYSVAEIANMVGYSNVPSFHRAFKRVTSKTPSEFRKEISSH